MQLKLALHSIQFPGLTPLPGQDHRINLHHQRFISLHSRLLFPLTFLLFNLLYWTHYAGKGGSFDWSDHKITGNIQ